MPDIVRSAPRVPASTNSLAACAALSSPLDMLRAKLRRTASGLAAQFRAVLAEMEPGFRIDRNNTIERWDGHGEGRACGLAFEGFGVTWLLFIGRTPHRTPKAAEEAAAWAR